MIFQLSDELLHALRQHRAQQRVDRVDRVDRAKQKSFRFVRSAFHAPALTIGDFARRIFSGKKRSIEATADDYVRGMDQLQLEVEDEHDAFLLDPGMGPMTYITADGRILYDERTWSGDGLREAADDDEAIKAVVVGALKTGIAALLELIPRQPDDGRVCPKCHGARWLELPRPAALLPDSRNQIICILCAGRGWVVQTMLDEAASRGYWPLQTT